MDVDVELAALQRRAYGPDADILADPAALARLLELEEAVRASAAGGAAGSDGVTTIPDSRDEIAADSRSDGGSSPQAHEAAAQTQGGGDGPEPAIGDEHGPAIAPVRAVGDVEPRERRLPRRIRLAWAASLVAAIAVAAGVAVWVFPFGARDATQHAARLTPQAGGARATDTFWNGVEMQYFGAYLGVEVYAGNGCVSALYGEETSQAGTGNCAGDGLRPVADLVVLPAAKDSPTSAGYIELPAQLSSRYPDGAIIRFTAGDDEVFVDVGDLPDAYRGMIG